MYVDPPAFGSHTHKLTPSRTHTRVLTVGFPKAEGPTHAHLSSGDGLRGPMQISRPYCSGLHIDKTTLSLCCLFTLAPEIQQLPKS